MSPKRVSPDDAKAPQPAPAAQSPQPTNLTVETTKGHLLTGLHATGKCRLTSKGKPVPWQDIDWYAGAAGEHLGTSQTDGRGIATIDGGSISDIGTSITGEIGGYSAKYLGSDEYLPSEGHGRVVPVFGIS
ncbi:hypothetical protein ACIQCR_15825 [Streptomyces sp. NPDC093249]|uniref:hypothetical protein n=1 Tax=unclassified Streptomyces TaxID=2593676 RepID=UPI00344EAF1C